jgi:hypothetical protein
VQRRAQEVEGSGGRRVRDRVKCGARRVSLRHRVERSKSRLRGRAVRAARNREGCDLEIYRCDILDAPDVNDRGASASASRRGASLRLAREVERIRAAGARSGPRGAALVGIVGRGGVGAALREAQRALRQSGRVDGRGVDR